MKIETISPLEAQYPTLLREITNPPPLLYYQGDISLGSSTSVAVVGSRKATPYGRWVAYSLAEKLANNGVTVVSGMASGIDSFAHRGALENGGKTIAVFGCGLDICYPPSNRELMERILENGLILSEYPPGTAPLPFRFPLRNRIISGICQGTVIVEAGLQSGSLITAEYAAEQGRNIYAVPGNINSTYSIGANKLIKDGALPLVVLDDLIEDLGIEARPARKEEILQLGIEEQQIYQTVLEYGEITSDIVCRLTGKRPSEVNAMITLLEIKGYLHTAQGKIFIAK